MIYPAIIVAVFCTLTNSISALQCYSCKGTGDDPCVQNPEAAAVATCSNYEACYMARREIRGPSDAASSVSIIRGCGQSPPAVASSTNGYSVSVNSQSCTTDLCNVGTGQQTFNINDFINNFQIPNINYDVNGGYKPAGYPLGYPTGYPTGYPNYPNYPTNDYPGYPGKYPYYPSYPNNQNFFYSNGAPDQAALLAPFLDYISQALKHQLQNFHQHNNFDNSNVKDNGAEKL